MPNNDDDDDVWYGVTEAVHCAPVLVVTMAVCRSFVASQESGPPTQLTLLHVGYDSNRVISFDAQTSWSSDVIELNRDQNLIGGQTAVQS